MGRTVLVTGVSLDLGGRLARLLASDPAQRVIGVDVVPPRRDLGVVEFVRADIRNPVIAKVIAAQGVDTVVHMSVSPFGHAGGRTSVKEHNVIGTMQLLAACQKAPSLERLVVRSASEVYGSSSRDPAMFTEDQAAKRLPGSGFGKDVLEVEGYVRGFARRRPDVAVTMMRAAPLIGPRVRSPLTDYFRLPVVPTPLGFDARLQFVHEDDLLAALRHATLGGVHGTFNVAGDGVLMLSQAVRRLGRPSVQLPAFALDNLGTLLKRVGVRGPDRELVSYLTFGRGLDTQRLRDVLGFTPEHDTASAFADFAGAVTPGMVPPTQLAAGVLTAATEARHG
ncbi:NAD-dependent epimerase/dehydratase family protein [Nocardioides mesophilus]|uniref:NAD-dependent epimerase/dehydratase family protein n=1 Tax=Nocardioides mesophilus TaxID=433659 RepID=A0A7G9R6M3_9ACTN|nr:NAD-dependent epimerase/dehydratase family protein [Nocardioides mesophilus]QNN51248.1 NAD-dependent epimerase/dehydratase family protein [Nocardioides mesophilus]